MVQKAFASLWCCGVFQNCSNTYQGSCVPAPFGQLCTHLYSNEMKVIVQVLSNKKEFTNFISSSSTQPSCECVLSWTDYFVIKSGIIRVIESQNMLSRKALTRTMESNCQLILPSLNSNTLSHQDKKIDLNSLTWIL